MIRRLNLFYILVFLYFLTLSAEQVNITLGIFKPRLNHLIALMLLGSIVWGQKSLRMDRKILFPFVWILGSMLVSASLSVSPLRCLGYVNVYLFSFLCYFVIPFNLMAFWDAQKVLKLYFCSFICVGLHAVIQLILSFFGVSEFFVIQYMGPIARGQSWTYEPSYYALYMTAFVMFRNAEAVFQEKYNFLKEKWKKLLFVNILLIISTSTGVIFTYPVFFLTCLLCSFLPYVRPYAIYVRKRAMLLSGLVMAVFSLIAVFFNELFLNSFYKFFYMGFLHHASFTTRWAGLVRCWNLFLEHPIFGVGVGGVGPYIYQNASGVGSLPETLREYEQYDPTNAFTEILASLGLVGFLGFCFLGWCFFHTFRKTVISPLLTSEERIQAIAFFVSLIVMLIALQYSQALFRAYIWTHAGIVFGYFYKLKNCLAHSSVEQPCKLSKIGESRP